MAFTLSPTLVTAPHTTSLTCASRPSFAGIPLQTRRAAASSSTPRMIFGMDIKQNLEHTSSYTQFLHLAKVANVDINVKNSTVFAPNDVAFDRMRPGLLDEILADSSYARAVVLRHILPGSVLTTKQIKGLGVWENIPGGPLEYQGIGSNVRIANATIVQESSNIECEAGTIHTVDTVLECPTVKPASFDQYYVSPVPHFGDSVVKTLYPAKMRSEQQRRAVGACLPSTTGGRKAMNLVQQLPFWMYGPPFNASKQVDLEPISCAEPEASVDYGVLPPGSVVVTPDEVSAAKLNPISGMSKHVGKMKRLVEGDGQSNYYRLDD